MKNEWAYKPKYTLSTVLIDDGDVYVETNKVRTKVETEEELIYELDKQPGNIGYGIQLKEEERFEHYGENHQGIDVLKHIIYQLQDAGYLI